MSDGAIELMEEYNGTEPEILNLGCGEDYMTGAVNVDIEPSVNPDRVVDLEMEVWPWDDDTFDFVLARHILEHLREPLDVLGEIQRITVPGGTVLIVYPIGHTRFEDPTHVHYWNYNTASWLAGEGQHMQENPLTLRLETCDVHVASGFPFNLAIAAKRWLLGDGPWLSQTTGMCGEVQARYRVSRL